MLDHLAKLSCPTTGRVVAPFLGQYGEQVTVGHKKSPAAAIGALWLLEPVNMQFHRSDSIGSWLQWQSGTPVASHLAVVRTV